MASITKSPSSIFVLITATLVHSLANLCFRSPKRGKSSKKSKRARSPSSSDSSSEEERRRKEKKDRKRRKEKDRDSRRDKRTRSRSRHDRSDEEDRRRRSRRSRSPAEVYKPRSPTHPPKSHEADEDDEWVVKDIAGAGAMLPPPVPVKALEQNLLEQQRIGDDDSDDEEVGPQPATAPNYSKRIDERSFGGALLRGEGSAMAAFLQDGTDSRIPRRGEIGLSSDEIAQYEDIGYVMSGSRHRRMNAVRMRKENQVISAEEKRGILKLQREERERREAILREEFSELVNERLKGTAEPKPRA